VGERITPSRATRKALALWLTSVATAAGLTGWLTLGAGPESSQPAAGLGAVAIFLLVTTLVVGQPQPIAGSLALLGAAYALILVIDEPPLDGRSAIVGALLLAIGELAHLSIEARPGVTDDAGSAARRFAFVALLTLVALALGGAMLALVDLLRTGGLAIEVVGVAAAAGAVGLLVLGAREAPRGVERDRPE